MPCSTAAFPAPPKLSAATLCHFSDLGILRHRDPHFVLFYEGLPAAHLLILCSGQVKVTSSSSNGRLFLLRVAVPGDILGLAALQEQAVHRVTAETLSACTIKSIPRADFVRLMEIHPDLSRLTALAIARDYHSALLSARRLAHHVSAAGKLASTLLDWAHADTAIPVPHSNLPISFPMLLNQEDLGNMAGLSRETVSRLLTRFRREGLIQQTDNQMTLNNPVRLEARFR